MLDYILYKIVPWQSYHSFLSPDQSYVRIFIFGADLGNPWGDLFLIAHTHIPLEIIIKTT